MAYYNEHLWSSFLNGIGLMLGVYFVAIPLTAVILGVMYYYDYFE